MELNMIMPEFDYTAVTLHEKNKQKKSAERKAKFATDRRKRKIPSISEYTGLDISKRNRLHNKRGTTYGHRPRPKRWSSADKLKAINDGIYELHETQPVPVVEEFTHTRIMATLINEGTGKKVFDVVVPRNDSVAFTDYMEMAVKFASVNLFSVYGNTHMSLDVHDITSDEADFLVKNAISSAEF